jgi:NAD(P)-dependent dehydrogenase (short-subunit alcohol dehydrogenase family)
VTKAAQIHLVKSLALIAGPIRINSVSPGVLMTVSKLVWVSYSTC